CFDCRVCLILTCTLIPVAASVAASCCLMYTKRPILGYTVQTINTSCDISAVMNCVGLCRFLCANPVCHTLFSNLLLCQNTEPNSCLPLQQDLFIFFF
uniref:Secreted protein n=1 Tax=Mola mola TaxID=94237 RepID=A0A3Q3W8C1_MOLML